MATAKKVPNPISTKIKQLMDKKGLTAYALGKMCDMPPSTVGRIISGKANPRPATLASIALALDTTIQNLVGEQKYNKLLSNDPVLKAVPNKRLPLITADTAHWLNNRNIDETKALSREDILWIPGLPDQDLSNLVDFCVVAPDDAMYPEIKKGDFLYFRKVTEKNYAKSGDIVAVIYRHDMGDPALDVRRVVFHQTFEEYVPAEQMNNYFEPGTLVFDENPDDEVPLHFGIIGVLVAKLSLSA